MNHQASIPGNDEAVTRLEVAIIVIAIVIVAALFTYFLAQSDIFSH